MRPIKKKFSKNNFFNSLRFRFALWTSGFLFIVLLFFSTYVYFYLENKLLTTIDDSLQLSASQAIAAVNIENDQINFSDSVPEGNTASLIQDRGLTIRILDLKGSIIDGYGPYRNSEIDSTAFNQAIQNQTTFNNYADNRQETGVRFFSAPIIENNQVVAIIQVAESLQAYHDTLNQLRFAILIGTPLLIFFAGLGGYFLSSKALSPIDKMTLTAQRISADDLSQRLNIHNSDDEVGRLAKTFDSMLERLEQSFKRERQFTADASHELRTPLAAMQAIISVTLSEKRKTKDYITALEDLSEETDRLKLFTEELLSLARNDANKPLNFEEVNISTLLSDLCDSLQPLAGQKNLMINYDFSNDYHVLGDLDRLISLFVNILDNAVKYSSSGDILVSIQQYNQLIEVRIKDKGIGISEQDLPMVFNRFFRVEKSRSKRGSGLGLAIAAEIAKNHGGTIAAESELGSGSEFIIRLPALKV